MRRFIYAALIWFGAASYAAAQVITGSVPNTFTNGTIIDATQMNADFSYIVSQVNTNGAKNGVNSDITALSALATPIPVASGGSTNFVGVTIGGTANAITVSTSVPNIAAFSYTTGYQVTLKAASTNTAATTINVNAIGVKNIYKQTPTGIQALTGGEIVATTYVSLIYDGVEFVLMEDATIGYGFGPLTSIAGAATTDLSTVPSRNAYVTGTTFTVTSLGSPAYSGIYYMVTWANSGAVSITAGASIVLNTASASRVVSSGDRQLWLWSGGVWTEVAYLPANVRMAPVGANKVSITNNAGTPSTKIDLTATETMMDNASGGNSYAESFGTCTIDLTVNGAAGLDTGVKAISTWYNVYAIGTGGAVSCLASVSATAPTMPTGYTYKVRLGAMLTDGAGNLYRTKQLGAHGQFTLVAATNTITYLAISSGATGSCATPTWTGSVVQGVQVPATASRITVNLYTSSGVAVAVGPTNVPTGYFAQPLAINSVVGSMTTPIQFDSTSLYYCSGATGTISAVGWDDQVNAN